MWSLQWGSRLDFLKQVEKETGETPLSLKNRKQPNQYTIQYWEAFQILSGSRTYTSAGPAAIPISEILAYFITYDIMDVDERHLYVHMIQAMDQVYLEHFNKK